MIDQCLLASGDVLRQHPMDQLPMIGNIGMFRSMYQREQTQWQRIEIHFVTIECDDIEYQRFESLKHKLTDDLPTTNEEGTTIERTKQRSWNNVTAPLLNICTVDSGSKGDIHSATNVNVAGTDKEIHCQTNKERW